METTKQNNSVKNEENSLRKLMLYPAELRGHAGSNIFKLAPESTEICSSFKLSSHRFTSLHKRDWGRAGENHPGKASAFRHLLASLL